ncbi:MAG: hypothetical protein P8J20_00445 [Novosphingobium sp.]|nr:hypothetical protein [Novosphingobium sp.]
MDLLLKREQTRNLTGRIVFRLWAKTEMGEDERALIDRYDIAESYLLVSDDFLHLKWAVILGLVTFFVTGGIMVTLDAPEPGFVVALIAGVAVGYWWINEKRETIVMRDMLHGRRFKCRSVIDLAKKEAMLENACIFLRQVVETAKHWDGVETCPVPVLAKDEAKALIVRAF